MSIKFVQKIYDFFKKQNTKSSFFTDLYSTFHIHHQRKFRKKLDFFRAHHICIICHRKLWATTPKGKHFFFNLSERMVLSNISRYIVRRAPIQNVCHTVDCVQYFNQTHWQRRESVIQKHMCLLCERDSMELRLLLIILYVVFVYNIGSTLFNENFFL